MQIQALKEKHRERRDGLEPATADTLLRVNMEILSQIKDMDTEDIAKLLQVFDRRNPTLDDLLAADSQRKKKNCLRKISCQQDLINQIVEIQDLGPFGTIKNKDGLKTFRSEIMGPLKLKQIITRKASDSLGGIQLIFEGGKETEFFDSGDTYNNSLVTYDVKDKPIK